MPREYKCVEARPNELPNIEHTYRGFNKDFTHPVNNPVNYLAVVLVEGEPEIWALDDNKNAAAELVRFLVDQEQGSAVILGCYKRV